MSSKKTIDFDFRKQLNLIASVKEVELAVESSLMYLLIDARKEEDFKKETLPTAINLPFTELFENNQVVSKKTILDDVLPKKSIKPNLLRISKVILFGNGSAAVVKAVLDHYNLCDQQIKIFEGGLPEWKLMLSNKKAIGQMEMQQ